MLNSCKKDIGNYDYTEINELKQTDIPKEITAIYGKQLVFNPTVSFTQDANFDETKYTYEWTYIGPNGLGGSKLFQLATTKNLNMQVSIVAGTYSAYFSVTNKDTGIKYTKPFTLKISNEINEGWIMMNEVNGRARVDMLSLNTAGTFDVINDLLATTNSGLTLTGKPVMAYTYNTGLLIGPDAISYGLYLGTDQGTTKIDPNTFKWTKTMTLNYEMFGDIPAGFYADVIQQRGSGTSYMIGKGNAYYYERVQNIYYSVPINYITSEQKGFEVAPFVGGDPSSITQAIFYDKTNRRFVKHTGSASTCTTLPDPPDANKLFSFSTKMDLLFMKWSSYASGGIFAVLKDPNSTKRYLARFNTSDNVQTYYAEILGTDFVNAEFYAVNPEFGYLFYAVGSKIYEYDMVYKTSKLMLDFGSKKISYLNFYEFKSNTKYPDRMKLMVGSYDPSISDGTEGSLGIYTVPGLNGDLVLAKSYTGFGKVKSITYRER
ncbi:hypothetical protein GCM10007422_32680 [Pedobacter zeae]|nr:hypothetical protein GCM10007422_32680 [Pedobacter zeae]